MKPSEKLAQLTRSKHIPLICTFELTRRCNLKCRHCYIDQPKTAKNELPTAAVKRILRQLAKAGSLNLVFTGGEIFLRDDIVELCRYARKLNFDLRLFTNATLITEICASRLSKIGLSSIEISLYGNKPEHERVTGSKGSFEKTLKAIALLSRYKIPVTVKCPVIKTNFKSYGWIVDFAKKHKLNYRFDPAISAKDSGDKSNLKYRLSGPQLEILFSDPLIAEDHNSALGEPDLGCSAGLNLLAVGYDGTVYPCLQYMTPLGSLEEGKLSEIWNKNNKALTAIREITLKDMPECAKCALAAICQRCPGIALLEDKTLYGPSRIACKIASIQASVSSKNKRIY